MTNNNNTATASSRGGISILGLLGIILVVLKLNPGGHLDSPVEGWSWWLVTLPFWLGFVIFLVLAFIAGLAFGAAKVLDKRNTNKRIKERQKRQDYNKLRDSYRR